jgi:hypothetical protein
MPFDIMNTTSKIMFASVCLVASASIAAAQPVSCDDFKEALGNAIHEAGDQVAQPHFDDAIREPDGRIDRVKMRGIVGLDGLLGCQKDSSFEVLDVTTEVSPEEGMLNVYRLRTLATAALCAVEKSLSPQACKNIMDMVSKDAVAAYSKARVRGEPDPYGNSRRNFDDGYELNFLSEEGQYGFILKGYSAEVQKAINRLRLEDRTRDRGDPAPVVPDLSGPPPIDSVPPDNH